MLAILPIFQNNGRNVYEECLVAWRCWRELDWGVRFANKLRLLSEIGAYNPCEIPICQHDTQHGRYASRRN